METETLTFFFFPIFIFIQKINFLPFIKNLLGVLSNMGLSDSSVKDTELVS